MTTAKILVVAGGGGGGGGPNWAGGGGAGGLLETTSFTLNQRTYPITIYNGGLVLLSMPLKEETVVIPFSRILGPTSYTATGGGGGGAGNTPKSGRSGGSGGGSGENRHCWTWNPR